MNGLLTRPLDLCCDNLEGFDDFCKIEEFKQTVMIKRTYQCGAAVYQLAKLQMFDL